MFRTTPIIFAGRQFLLSRKRELVTIGGRSNCSSFVYIQLSLDKQLLLKTVKTLLFFIFQRLIVPLYTVVVKQKE